MQNKNKPFAPFGALFYQLRITNIKLRYAPFLFCGKEAIPEAKKVIQSGQLALCLPMGSSIEDYDWPIAGLKLVVFDTGSMSAIGLTKISHALLKLGADVVCVHSPQKIAIDIHVLKKELNHGKEQRR